MNGKIDALWRRSVKRGLIAGGLETAGILARAGLMREARGRGAIFTLHHVRPPEPRLAAPNAHLEVTPQFLDAAISRLAEDGYDFVALQDVPARLAEPPARPFACFTLDDGYRNNVEHALPVFERYQVPFTIFINEGFADRTHTIWWETLAELLNETDRLSFDFGAGPETLDLTAGSARLDAFDRFALYIERDNEADAVAELDALACRHGIEPLDITRRLTLGREDLSKLSRHPLASLGAHTVSHRALKRLSDADAGAEMKRSADWLEALTGTRPAAIAYPYGTQAAVSERDQALAQALGFTVAVTTQPGTVCAADTERLTALPRISLNGYYQEPRYVAALASGIPFAMGTP
ncbi:peptidoglycan/xylan/chitin deacetylase (PgdA/CDA1 family) [Neorhizobium galegae]|uniref:polysaccharide deacetylase family protein n=1 Tax=Neorhizobium galegae TaxID=399 RepID=UPI001AE46F97|nr:polysaccharide deacetylase family protein [Neorhizobium galegae]MBP2547754.1 peptidoglycan/xylan/chitin deacetylase (PgdA/CDA1 family) [Neorhizobium galegae]